MADVLAETGRGGALGMVGSLLPHSWIEFIAVPLPWEQGDAYALGKGS